MGLHFSWSFSFPSEEVLQKFHRSVLPELDDFRFAFTFNLLRFIAGLHGWKLPLKLGTMPPYRVLLHVIRRNSTFSRALGKQYPLPKPSVDWRDVISNTEEYRNILAARKNTELHSVLDEILHLWNKRSEHESDILEERLSSDGHGADETTTDGLLALRETDVIAEDDHVPIMRNADEGKRTWVTRQPARRAG